MNTKFLYSIVLALGLAFAGSNFSNIYAQTPKKTETKAHAAKYVCPMHPKEIKDKPGTCSICGMKLVLKKEKKETKKDTTKMQHSSNPKGMAMELK